MLDFACENSKYQPIDTPITLDSIFQNDFELLENVTSLTGSIAEALRNNKRAGFGLYPYIYMHFGT